MSRLNVVTNRVTTHAPPLENRKEKQFAGARCGHMRVRTSAPRPRQCSFGARPCLRVLLRAVARAHLCALGRPLRRGVARAPSAPAGPALVFYTSPRRRRRRLARLAMASLEPVRAAYDAKDVAASAEAHAAKASASAGADAPR